jgi:DNA processing protein
VARDSDAERATAAALASLPHMGPKRLEALVRTFGMLGAWEAVSDGSAARQRTIRATMGREPDEIDMTWRAFARRTDPSELLARHLDAGIEVVPLGSDRYPAVLAADHERPMVLFVRGDVARLSSPRVALVGTRRATSGGRRTAREWGCRLTEMGVQVVSGLALGIDGAAHLGALEACATAPTPAPPLGVVGTGLDVVYPRRHAELWERVASEGLLMSEIALGGSPTRWRFPARNRLIAAMSDVIVVVESHAKGGALSTAEEAIARDRSVMAVPGSIHVPASAGSNRLLVDGMAPACDVGDVITQLALSSCDLGSAEAGGGQQRDGVVARGSPPGGVDTRVPRGDLDPTDRMLLDRIGWEPMALDRLAEDAGLSLGELSVRLLDLEARGLIVRRGAAIEQVDPR